MNTRAYHELLTLQKEAALLASMQGILEWDQRTYMPPAASTHRADQSAYLAGVIHHKSTDPKIDSLLKVLEMEDQDADSPEAVNIREWRRDFNKRTKLSRELVEELARTSALARTLETRA
jgi:carboxypeptidase Taq